MATRTYAPIGAPQPRRSRRGAWGVAVALLGLIVVVLVVLALTVWSSVTLAGDPSALARISTQPFAGTIEGVTAASSDGQSIPVAVRAGRIEPLVAIRAGEAITVTVSVRRPSWLAWALGSVRTEQLVVHAPSAHVRSRWLTVAPGSPVRVTFEEPVTAVAYGPPGHLVRQALSGPQRSITVLTQEPVGTIDVAAAVRRWERLSTPVAVSWFPPSSSAVVDASPAPGVPLSSSGSIRLTFSKPVRAVLGSSLPQLVPATNGSWRLADSHTLVFTPSGLGVPFDTYLHVLLPRGVAVAAGSSLQPATEISWPTPVPSTLRLQQLLAEQGYLPLSWAPASTPVARTAAAQLAAAVAPPRGSFQWRYPNTPGALQAIWSAGQANIVTKGAVMRFELEHHLAVDGIAGPMVWHALLTDALAGRRYTTPYCYVFVHTELPQKLTLWCAGRVVLTSPGNTGVASAPTRAGTYAVFEHIPVGTMSGTNPDGTRYDDPGVRWISYFNGGDALHAFPRASYGTPQSLGCVELPLAAAAAVWPHTPIGTLVTIENSPQTPT